MTSTPDHDSDQGSSARDPSGLLSPSAATGASESLDLSFGTRLRAAREARKLDIEACALTLKLPVRVLRQLERDQYDGIDSKIYLASYIGKYGRHLGVNDVSIQVELDRIKHVEPPLMATGGISHSRFLFDRYATAATYVVLTLVIAVPTIWFGVRSTLDRDISHLAPLDAAPVAQADSSAIASSAGVDGGRAAKAGTPPAPVATPEQEHPLMASMAPFPGLAVDSATSSPSSAATSLDSGRGEHALSLNLTAASWVEVTDTNGKRLEYGLLPAGSHHTYQSDQPLDVRIGNASGAQVSVDDQAVPLEDFRRANVAHFRVQIQGGKASAASL